MHKNPNIDQHYKFIDWNNKKSSNEKLFLALRVDSSHARAFEYEKGRADRKKIQNQGKKHERIEFVAINIGGSSRADWNIHNVSLVRDTVRLICWKLRRRKYVKVYIYLFQSAFLPQFFCSLFYTFFRSILIVHFFSHSFSLSASLWPISFLSIKWREHLITCHVIFNVCVKKPIKYIFLFVSVCLSSLRFLKTL